jgi:response regulator RpfG family c-di-GMP phosphodiesterase
MVSPEDSKQRLLIDRGRHFDPEVVDAFLTREDAFKEILIRFPDKKA